MKAIKERAKKYARKVWRGGTREYGSRMKLTECDFIAGAQSEREELTRWRNPNEELPELLILVLGKQSDSKKTYYKVVYRREYDDDDGYYWTDNGCRSLYIDGWRPIYENE